MNSPVVYIINLQDLLLLRITVETEEVADDQMETVAAPSDEGCLTL